MKKRLFCLCLALMMSFLLPACGGEEPETTEGEVFVPLLRFVVEEGSEGSVRLFSCPESDGFFYLHPAPEGGFSGGFLSTSRSISSESVVKETATLSFAAMRENGVDRATMVSDAGITNLLLKQNVSETRPMPEGIDLSGGLYYDELTLLGETEELLVLCPVDLSETYVLAEKKKLAEFAEPLLVAGDAERVYYALKGEGAAFGGIAYFEPGKDDPRGVEHFPFDSFQRIGTDGALFCRALEDGGMLYLYRNFAKGAGGSFVADRPFDGVTCSEDGTVLVGAYSGDGEGTVVVCDLASGKERGRYVSELGAPCPSMALSPDGKTLLLALVAGGEEVLGILDLERIG